MMVTVRRARRWATVGACGLVALVVDSGREAAAQDWRSLGLEGEYVSAVAIDLLHPDTLWAGSSSHFSAGKWGGVFRSSDGGVSWDTLVRGVSVTQIAVHPISADTVFVCTNTANYSPPGILKTTNGGQTWAWSDSGISFGGFDLSVVCMAINPHIPRSMYTGTGGQGGGSLYRSKDGGSFWEREDIPIDTPTSLAFDPEWHDLLYLGTGGFGYLFSTGTGGAKWQTLLANVGGIRTIVRTHAHLFVEVAPRGGRVLRSTDDGETWSAVGPDTASHEFLPSLVLSTNPRHRLFLTASGVLMASADSGLTWDSLGGLPNNALYARLFVNNPGGALYAAPSETPVQIGGLFQLHLTTNVTEETRFAPEAAQMSVACFPNPFNGSTTVQLRLTRASHVTIAFTDILGRELGTIADARFEAGESSVVFDAARLATGLYFILVRGEQRAFTKVMVVR